MKKWLERFFGIDVLKKEMKVHITSYKKHSKRAKQFEQEYEQRIKDLQNLMSILNKGKLGMDVSFNKHDRSWAVVCLGKHPDAVYFYQFPNNRAIELSRFLRDFQKELNWDRNNRIIDNPFREL